MKWAKYAICLSLLLSVSFSALADPLELFFIESKIYQVPGWQLNKLQLDLMTSRDEASDLKKQAEALAMEASGLRTQALTVSKSFEAYKKRTMALEIGLCTISLASIGTAIYFGGLSANWW